MEKVFCVAIERHDGVEIEVGESSNRRLTVVMPEMINKAVQHVRMAKAQRHFLRDRVAAALDTNISYHV
jgi:hypothetical protein